MSCWWHYRHLVEGMMIQSLKSSRIRGVKHTARGVLAKVQALLKKSPQNFFSFSKKSPQILKILKKVLTLILIRPAWAWWVQIRPATPHEFDTPASRFSGWPNWNRNYCCRVLRNVIVMKNYITGSQILRVLWRSNILSKRQRNRRKKKYRMRII